MTNEEDFYKAVELYTAEKTKQRRKEDAHAIISLYKKFMKVD